MGSCFSVADASSNGAVLYTPVMMAIIRLYTRLYFGDANVSDDVFRDELMETFQRFKRLVIELYGNVRRESDWPPLVRMTVATFVDHNLKVRIPNRATILHDLNVVVESLPAFRVRCADTISAAHLKLIDKLSEYKFE